LNVGKVGPLCRETSKEKKKGQHCEQHSQKSHGAMMPNRRAPGHGQIPAKKPL